MTNARSVSRRSSTVSSLALAFGPMLALAATLAVAPEAAARPKTCLYKAAACDLESQRAERRGAAEASSPVGSPTPGRARLLCASKSAACELQQKAEAKRAEGAAASTTKARVETRPPSCNLKPAACWLQERQNSR